MRRKRNITLAMALPALAALLFLSARLAAQQATPSAAIKMVPDNPSEHPAPTQPIPYSHKQHLAFSLQCKDCHTNPDAGKLMTYPATEKCMQCHVTIGKDKPSIQKIADYAKSKQPIPWVRVYKVLPGVEWSHRPHLAAGVKCETCHGPMREVEAVSEVTSVTTMYSCLHCHELNNAKTACDTCHKR